MRRFAVFFFFILSLFLIIFCSGLDHMKLIKVTLQDSFWRQSDCELFHFIFIFPTCLTGLNPAGETESMFGIIHKALVCWVSSAECI